ncbi:MAG: hypothetical protein ABW154_11295 [Dyella sp.]
MKRTHRRRLLLFVGVAALVLLVIGQLRHEAKQQPQPLLTLQPQAIAQISVRRQGADAEHYQRRDGHWWRVDGTSTRDDDGRLDEIAQIAAAPVIYWRPVSDFQPTAIGLQPPAVTLNLDGQQIEFGDVAATAPLRYVRVGARIALIPLRYMPRPARPAR